MRADTCSAIALRKAAWVETGGAVEDREVSEV